MKPARTVSIRTNSPSYHQEPEPAAKTHLVTASIDRDHMARLHPHDPIVQLKNNPSEDLNTSLLTHFN